MQNLRITVTFTDFVVSKTKILYFSCKRGEGQASKLSFYFSRKMEMDLPNFDHFQSNTNHPSEFSSPNLFE